MLKGLLIILNLLFSTLVYNTALADTKEAPQALLSSIIESSNQKDLHIPHTPQGTELTAIEHEEVNFSIDTSKVNAEYIFFYSDEKDPSMIDCNVSNCRKNVVHKRYIMSYDHNLTALVKTKNGTYDKVMWQIVEFNSKTTYIKDKTPSSENVNIKINKNKTFEIEAQDDNSNLWKIELYKDNILIASTEDKNHQSCKRSTNCSLSYDILFDKFDINEVKGVITKRISDGKYYTETIVWNTKVVEGYINDVIKPFLWMVFKIILVLLVICIACILLYFLGTRWWNLNGNKMIVVLSTILGLIIMPFTFIIGIIDTILIEPYINQAIKDCNVQFRKEILSNGKCKISITNDDSKKLYTWYSGAYWKILISSTLMLVIITLFFVNWDTALWLIFFGLSGLSVYVVPYTMAYCISNCVEAIINKKTEDLNEQQEKEEAERRENEEKRQKQEANRIAEAKKKEEAKKAEEQKKIAEEEETRKKQDEIEAERKRIEEERRRKEEIEKEELAKQIKEEEEKRKELEIELFKIEERYKAIARGEEMITEAKRKQMEIERKTFKQRKKHSKHHTEDMIDFIDKITKLLNDK